MVPSSPLLSTAYCYGGSAVLAMAAVRAGRRLLAFAFSLSYFVPISLLYAYAAATRQYVNLDLLYFAYSNFVQLIFHLLQQAFWPAVLLLVLWLCSCLIFAAAIMGTGASGVQLRSGLLSIGAAVAVGFLMGGPHPAWSLWPAHISTDFKPDVSTWVVRQTNDATDRRGQAVHPIIVVYIESLRYTVVEKNPSPIPHLRSLIAREGYLFTRSYTAATSSHYSNPAFWFSQYPLRSARFRQVAASDPWPRRSFFDSLKSFGYETAYVSSQNEYWGGMISWMKTPSVDFFFHSEDHDGATLFDDNDPWSLSALLEQGIITSGKVPDHETLQVASNWISSRDPATPFAIGITLQNTHHSYYIPEGAPEPFQPSTIDFPAIFGHWPQHKKEHMYNRYLNAVYNVDSALVSLFDDLKQRGLWDESLILVTGDGGEAFYEHGYANHAGPLYDEATRSFTWMKPPVSLAGSTPRVVDKPISHIDLVPSMFDLLGLPIPAEHQGLPFRSSERPEVYLYANGSIEQDGIVDWPWKFLVTFNGVDSGPELYRLDVDPYENDNVIEQHPQTGERLKAMLETWRATQLAYYTTPALYERYFPPRYALQEEAGQSETTDSVK